MADLALGHLRAKIPQLRAAFEAKVRDHHRFLLDRLLLQRRFIVGEIAALDQRLRQIDVQEPDLAATVTRWVTVPGIDRAAAWSLVAEMGNNMAQFPTAAHLASLAGMCPGNYESAGKRPGAKMRKGSPWLRHMACESAWAAARTKNTYLSAHEPMSARPKVPLRAFPMTERIKSRQTKGTIPVAQEPSETLYLAVQRYLQYQTQRMTEESYSRVYKIVKANIEFKTWSLKESLGDIGYPGYEYPVREARANETAALLLDALGTDDLDQRVVEALPWVLANRRDLNWNYLIEGSALARPPEPVGYLLEVTVQALKKIKLPYFAAELEPRLIQLREVRINQECTLCKDSMTQ